MGQQQLLLIVLGVIIVGIAVVVGINVFTASSLEANKSALVSDLQTIASMAQQYYRKPTAMGGGGNTFTGWTVPNALIRTANMSADVVPTVAAQSVSLVATGTEDGSNGNKGTVTLYINPNSIDSVKFSDNYK
jgi:type II secretory pathway pseudopilin PulG